MIPSMRCDVGCGECCGVVPATETEFRGIERFIGEHGITPAAHTDGTCPFYQEGVCAVHAVRPLVCRLFGHSADPLMTCARGYNVNVPERDVVRMVRANGKTTHVLHELAPNWQDIKAPDPRTRAGLSPRKQQPAALHFATKIRGFAGVMPPRPRATGMLLDRPEREFEHCGQENRQ